MNNTEEFLKTWRLNNKMPIEGYEYLQAMFTFDELIKLLTDYDLWKWTSVETLPQQEGDYNCLTTEDKVITATYNVERMRFERYRNSVPQDRTMNYYYDNITHYQPLPTFKK